VTTVAAIDCGTNSIRLLIASPLPGGGLDDLDRRTEVVRLGQGVDATGEFHPDALRRTFAVVEQYAKWINDPEGTREMVEALGYRIRRLFLGVFMTGSALAGLGGVMWALYREQVHASMSDDLTVLIFIVVIIGGLGSIGGCFIGAILVAMVANYGGFLVPKLALVSNILLMVAILMWRPRGLYAVTSR